MDRPRPLLRVVLATGLYAPVDSRLSDRSPLERPRRESLRVPCSRREDDERTHVAASRVRAESRRQDRDRAGLSAAQRCTPRLWLRWYLRSLRRRTHSRKEWHLEDGSRQGQGRVALFDRRRGKA